MSVNRIKPVCALCGLEFESHELLNGNLICWRGLGVWTPEDQQKNSKYDADDPLGIKAAQRISNGHHKLTLNALKQQHDAASDHGVRGMIDGKMWDLLAKFVADNPRKLPVRVVSVLVSADRCAKCLGALDTDRECNDCGYDWKPWIDASSAINDESNNHREA